MSRSIRMRGQRRLPRWIGGLTMVVLPSLLVADASTAPIQAEIDDEISYHRGRPPTSTNHGSQILDLRGLPLDEAELADWLKSGPLRVVLLDSDQASNPPDWWGNRGANVILVAPATALTAPSPHALVDIKVVAAAEEVASALAAIDAGTDIAILADPPVRKRRFDESALMRRHQGEPPVPPTPDDVDADESNGADASDGTSTTDSGPTDAMLERAVQVIRGLRALGYQ